MDLSFNYDRAKLFDSGQIGHNSQTFTANLFVVNLDNKIDKDIHKLSFGASMFLIAHKNFFIIEKKITQTTQYCCYQFLNK